MSPMPQLRADPETLSAVVVVLPVARPLLSVVAPLLASRCCRTGDPFTTVTLPSPQMQVNGNTNVRSPSSNRRRAVIGVYRTSVRVSVPYLPLEKLGVEPNCHWPILRDANGRRDEQQNGGEEDEERQGLAALPV